MRRLMYTMNTERVNELLKKPVQDLIEMIMSLEEENEKLREYRTKLIKVRNLVVPDEEKRKQGRPRKDSEEVI